MPRWDRNNPFWEAVISAVITGGLDLAKNVFQVPGADGSGQPVLRMQPRRDQVLDFFRRLPSCVVAMEACGGAHFWGHEGRLIPPAYVKPFVKRQKTTWWTPRRFAKRPCARVQAGPRKRIERSGGAFKGAERASCR